MKQIHKFFINFTCVLALVLAQLYASPFIFGASAVEPNNWDETKALIGPDTESYAPAKYSQGNVIQKIGNDGYFKRLNNKNNQNKFPKSYSYPSSPSTPGSFRHMDASQLATALPAAQVNTEKGFAYNFSTHFIPIQFSGNNAEDPYNLWSVQGMTKQGEYFYLFKTVGHKGSIVRIHEKVAELEAVDGYALALIATDMSNVSGGQCQNNYANYPCSALKKYAEYIKFGQSIPLDGSHGGSLASDGESLWITLEPNDDPYINPSLKQRLIKIDPDTLRATKEYSYNMSNTFDVGQAPYTQQYMIKDVAFTAPGKFVGFWQADGEYWFFIGSVDENVNQVSIKIAPNILTKQIGWGIQNFACNRAAQELYLVADGVIASFPVSLLTAKLDSNSWRSVRYSSLKTNREAEGLAFDDDGSNIYLFLFQRAEILKASTNQNYPFDYNVALGERQEDILWLMENKYAAGSVELSRTTYRPDNKVNRGAMAQFMYNVSGQPAFQPSADEKNRFSDLSGLNAERKFAIQWLVHNGITKGCDEAGTKFCPASTVNRGSMAEFLARLSGVTFTAQEVSNFPDVFTGSTKTITYKNGSKLTKTLVNAVVPDRVNAINWLAQVEVTVGSQTDDSGVTTFRAQDPVTRGSMAQFLKRWKTSETIPHPLENVAG